MTSTKSSLTEKSYETFVERKSCTYPTRKTGLLEFAGILDAKTADRLKKSIKKSRALSRKRFARTVYD